MARSAKRTPVIKPRPEYDPNTVSNVDTSMLDKMTRGELKELPIEVLYELQCRVDDEIAKARERKTVLDDLKLELYSERAKSARNARDKDHGVIHLINVPYNSDEPATSMVICQGKKTVKWDQKTLTAIREKIAGAGDDPDNWIVSKVEYWIPEQTYEHMTEAVKAVMLTARTVVIKEDFTIELIDEKP